MLFCARRSPCLLTNLGGMYRRTLVQQADVKPEDRVYSGTRRRVKLKLKERRDTQQVDMSKRLCDVLKNSTKNGITTREDGYVPVAELLNHPQFRNIDFFTLEKLVFQDQRKRYHLILEKHGHRDNLKADSWWIRLSEGRETPETALNLQRVVTIRQIPHPIYLASEEEWVQISRTGLVKGKNGFIHLYQRISPENLVLAELSRSSQTRIHIQIDLESAMQRGIKFFLALEADPSPFPSNGPFIPRKYAPVLTPGDEFGVLSPDLFLRVDKISTRWRALPDIP
ncbi:KptA family-domain-containing protein [Crucibulum laeve]|uniref:2'-phosphotransferase n=1 Tax=Crucibulum laeve TaxID=68775 RepID=A0A5C3M3T9_9AGAR|nr:KptA family-domain-containing protein [Crucibulum laeve]